MTQRKLTYFIVFISFVLFIIANAITWGQQGWEGLITGLLFLILSPIFMIGGYFYGAMMLLHVIALFLLLLKHRFASLLCSFFPAIWIIHSMFFAEDTGINASTFFSVDNISVLLLLLSILLLFAYNVILLVHSTVKYKDKASIRRMKIFASLMILLIAFFIFYFVRVRFFYKIHINKTASKFLTIKGYIAPELTGSLSLLYTTSNPLCKKITNVMQGESYARTKKLFEYKINPDSKGQFSLRLPIDKVQPGYCKWKVRSILYNIYPKKGKVDYDKDKELSVFSSLSKTIDYVPQVKFNCQQFKFQSQDDIVCENNYEFKQIPWGQGTILFDIRYSKRRGDYDVKPAPSRD